MTNRSL